MITRDQGTMGHTTERLPRQPRVIPAAIEQTQSLEKIIK